MKTNRHRFPITLGAIGLLIATGASLCAEVPRKQPIARYTDLWSKSPFTVPPAVAAPEAVEVNPLDDFTLAGVAKLKDGWFVVLINKKEREKRLRIKPNTENTEGFQIVKVDHGDNHMKTRVEIKTRSGKTGWVEYDKKFIALRKAAPAGGGAPNPAAQNQNPNPNQNPNQPPIPVRPTANLQPPVPNANGGAPGGRPARVRRVPTPPPPSR